MGINPLGDDRLRYEDRYLLIAYRVGHGLVKRGTFLNGESTESPYFTVSNFAIA